MKRKTGQVILLATVYGGLSDYTFRCAAPLSLEISLLKAEQMGLMRYRDKQRMMRSPYTYSFRLVCPGDTIHLTEYDPERGINGVWVLKVPPSGLNDPPQRFKDRNPGPELGEYLRENCVVVEFRPYYVG